MNWREKFRDWWRGYGDDDIEGRDCLFPRTGKAAHMTDDQAREIARERNV